MAHARMARHVQRGQQYGPASPHIAVSESQLSRPRSQPGLSYHCPGLLWQMDASEVSGKSCFVAHNKGTLTKSHNDCANTSTCKIESIHSGVCTVLLSSLLCLEKTNSWRRTPLQLCLSNPFFHSLQPPWRKGTISKMPLRERARLAHRACISDHAAHVLDVCLTKRPTESSCDLHYRVNTAEVGDGRAHDGRDETLTMDQSATCNDISNTGGRLPVQLASAYGGAR